MSTEERTDREGLRAAVEAVKALCARWESDEEVDEWHPVRELRTALGAGSRTPEPRPERHAPKREDVLAFYELCKAEDDDDRIAATIDYALSYAEPYETPRWDHDPIVIKYGWLDGRCGRCGEELPGSGSPEEQR